jgi:molybdopterin synthase sulfur carrier subunit
MKLKIKAFGIAREIVGSAEVELDVDNPINVEQLRELLTQKYPEFRSLRSMFLAVNNAYANDTATLAEHDEIALIPPVSGG